MIDYGDNLVVFNVTPSCGGGRESTTLDPIQCVVSPEILYHWRPMQSVRSFHCISLANTISILSLLVTLINSANVGPE